MLCCFQFIEPNRRRQCSTTTTKISDAIAQSMGHMPVTIAPNANVSPPLAHHTKQAPLGIPEALLLFPRWCSFAAQASNREHLATLWQRYVDIY